MQRRGFTLVELLIVITILLALATLVVAVYTANHGAEKTREASRILQSALLGAKDRAIQSGKTYGVRLSIDATIPNAITSLSYVEQPDAYTSGFVQLWRDASGLVTVLKEPTGIPAGYPRTNWYALKTLGVLRDGARIKLPVQGSWYKVDTSQLTANSETLIIRPKFRTAPVDDNPANPAFASTFDYLLELYPQITSQQPIILPAGIAIDVARSINLPTVQPLDVLFSVRGVPTGITGAKGKLYFVLSDIGDVSRNLDPSQREHDMLIVAVKNSGAVMSHPADASDADADGKADNLFRYAETGASAAK